MTGPQKQITWTEKDRLAALETYEILDTPREADFDQIAEMAAQICEMPVSVVNLVAENRQWFKAEIGLGIRETALDVSICAHAILQPGVFVVPDTTKDDRFKSNPLVTGKPHLRFYAGAPLETPEGIPLGTLCVLDYKPRSLTEKQLFLLTGLARQATAQMELRRSLNAQKKAERRLASAVESSGLVGTWEWDILKNQIFSDAHFSRIFSLNAHGASEGRGIQEYIRAIHPDDLPRARKEIELAIKTGEQFISEYRLIGADDKIRWISASGRCHFDAEGRAIRFPGVAVDITARKESEDAILEAENQLRQMTNSLPQTVWGARPDGTLDYISDRGHEYIGEIAQKDGQIDWLSVVHPEDHHHSMRVWKKSLETGQPFQVEQRIFEKSSKTFRWNLSRARPIRDQEGKIVRWFGTNTDISEFKDIQHALWQTQERLAQQNQILDQTVQERTFELTETIRELEAFSFSISHDMRSPLRAMQGYSDALLADYGDKLDETAALYLKRIHRGATRLDLLIRDVLAYSKVAKENVQVVELNAEAIIRDILETYPNLDAAHIKVTLSEIPLVMAHEGLFTQIVSNFLGNAQKFVRPGSFPEVKISAERVDSQVRIWFKDQGLGIAPEHHEQIFQIFGRVYPEKEYEGTGIGLAIVKKSAERMGGSVGVISELGRGSRFWLNLKGAR